MFESEYLLYAYVTAIGFCAAGLCTSAWQLVTGLPLKFGLQAEHSLAAIFGVLARVMAGPVIVMRNAIRGAAIEGRAPLWLALSTFISTLWSFFIGVIMLELLYRL
ncbi:hypothetical protein BMS3Bbin10_00021 [bacterium BMS3Bbin10]|nr:hypothetical protein BMS3Bbin10_00021 [bacterium BMS3Bbin10]